MKLHIVVSMCVESKSKKRAYICDILNPKSKEYSIHELIDFIKNENLFQLDVEVSVKDFLTGNNLKLFLEAIKASSIESVVFINKEIFESDEDFSHFLEINILDKMLYLIENRGIHLEFMVKTEERVRKILNNKDMVSTLTSKVPFKQSFLHSCSAYSIMTLLHEDTIDFNMYRELFIYSQVWESPGKLADPLKIKNYLNKNDYNVSFVIDPVLTNKYCEKSSQFKTKLNFFKAHFDRADVDEGGINDRNFTDNGKLLLINSGGLHIISAKNVNGNVKLCDSYSADRKVFKSVQDFIFSECGDSPSINTGYIGASLSLSTKKI